MRDDSIPQTPPLPAHFDRPIMSCLDCPGHRTALPLGLGARERIGPYFCCCASRLLQAPTAIGSLLYHDIRVGRVGELFAGDLGMAYLGSQGDVWDSHKDVAMASLAAVVAMCFTALVNRHLQRDFTREWIESLYGRHKEPLGEDEIMRLSKKW